MALGEVANENNDSEREYREKLLRMVKKEVKQIMEEAVTRKFVHEESSSITSLCATVDACLSHGLKRRALGLFKTNSTTALMQKVAKNYDPAAEILKKVREIENADPNKRSSSSSDSTNKLRHTASGIKKDGQAFISKAYNQRYLWIRIAIFEKQLVNIVNHLVQNSNRYYEKEALVSDPVAGEILASLLVGPCALDFTKMKTTDHYWTDPPADELVQRHRLSSPLQSNGPSTPPLGRKPLVLPYNKNKILGTLSTSHPTKDSISEGSQPNDSPVANSVGSGSIKSLSSIGSTSSNGVSFAARDYVESLHQNSKSTLLYGKNNVIIQPRENVDPLPGYLSLHQSNVNGLIIKWTPNQLMNAGPADSPNKTDSVHEKRSPIRSPNRASGTHSRLSGSKAESEPNYWDYAMSVNVDEIVYLHCHQDHEDAGGTIVLVGQDGVQRPPIRFPRGGHLLAFLSCLENGLAPYGQLDPPLWSQKGKGKVFPRLKRRGHRPEAQKDAKESEEDDEEASDYVFRIISAFDKPDSISQEMMDPKLTQSQGARASNYLWRPKNKQHPSTSSTTSTCSTVSQSSEDGGMGGIPCPPRKAQSESEQAQSTPDKSIQTLCDTMKRQLVSRAFYGWLAHCRHLKTVRTHLAGLVNPKIIPINEPKDACGGLTVELWEQMHDKEGRVTNELEVYRLIYYGGVAPSIRKKVWPYLLGHYDFGSTWDEQKQRDKDVKEHYDSVVSEWSAVEVVVRQRDKEILAANLAKLSSESTTSTEMPLTGPKDNHVSNEVFENSSAEVDDEAGDEDENEKEEEDTGRDGKSDSNRETSDSPQRTQPLITANKSDIKTRLSSVKKPKNRKARLIRQDSQSQSIAAANSTSESNGPPDPKAMTNQNASGKQLDRKESSLSSSSSSSKSSVSKTLSSSSTDSTQMTKEATQNGASLSGELLDLFALNIHRIDKDVQRCDRNYWYFSSLDNLEKLRNVMCSYVWQHLDIGYVQGMCDLVAPLLVIFDDEMLTYSCFCELMKRMVANFPHGGAMDGHFANMRSLIQILDADMFALMHENGDYTHFYFCYRWFLLDFKRELVYDDVFCVWETIWSAKHVASANFVLFIALALVEYYRDIILENNMDFTDIIKFFNEMAERHDAKAVLAISRDLVLQIQTLIDEK